MLIALDANIWVAERLLRSAVGSAFLHALRRVNGQILLPDVTHGEVVAEVGRAGVSAVEKIESGMVTIQALTGSRPACRLPSEADCRQTAQERLQELASLLREMNLSLLHHERALVRLHEHRPPAETRENYRDCLLWEALLDEREGVAVLVSADKDFRDKQRADAGLASALALESNNEVSLFPSLKDFLVATEPQIPPVESSPIIDAISKQVLPLVLKHADNKGFTVGQARASKLELFATEQVEATAAVFELTYSAYDIPLPDGFRVEEGLVVASGDCIVRVGNEIAGLKMAGILPYTLTGERLSGGIHYAYGTDEGRRVPYRVRAPIPGGAA